MYDEIKSNFLKMFRLAEAIALLIAFIPLIIRYFEFLDTPTDITQLADFIMMTVWFLIGQIPGWFIAIIVYGLFGERIE